MAIIQPVSTPGDTHIFIKATMHPMATFNYHQGLLCSRCEPRLDVSAQTFDGTVVCKEELALEGVDRAGVHGARVCLVCVKNDNRAVALTCAQTEETRLEKHY